MFKKSEVKLVNFIDRKFKKINFNYSNFLKGKIFQFRSPSPEHGALSFVKKSLDINNKVDVKNYLTLQNIKDADATEVLVYCRKKEFSFDINKDEIFITTYNVLKDIFINKNFVYKSIKDPIFALNVLPKSTSSGYPLFKKKNNQEAIKHSFKMINLFNKIKFVDSKFLFLFSNPTCIFHRFSPKSKEGKDNIIRTKFKIRQIFGVPQFICMLEVMYFSSIVYRFKEVVEKFSTIGNTKVEVSNKVSNLRDNAFREKKLIVCGDIKGCDKSISDTFHKMFFSIWYDAIEYNEDKKAYLSIAKYLTRTPIISSRLKLDTSNGSTTTGSWLTTVFTTFCILFVISYYYIKKYNRLPYKDELLIQGDDFLMLIDEEGDYNELVKIFEKFNLNLKSEMKCVVEPNDDIEFLGYFWDRLNQPFQTKLWILSRIIFPEKRIKFTGAERVICRYLSIIFQLRDYYALFKRFYNFDLYLRNKFRNSKKSFNLTLIDNNGNITNTNYPIDRALLEGWRMF